MLPALTAAWLAVLPQQPEPVDVTFVNTAPVSRRQTVPVSVPYAQGRLRTATAAANAVFEVDLVEGGQTRVVPAIVLMRWPDRSVQLLQVHAGCEVEGRARGSAQVLPRLDEAGLLRGRASTAETRSVPMLDAACLPLATELVDAWGRVFRADLAPDQDAGVDGVVFDSGAVRLRRFRSSHRLLDENGQSGEQALFDLSAYLLTFAGERRAELTLLLDNREPQAGALGPVRFSGFRLLTFDDRLRFRPRFAAENLLPPPRPRSAGGYLQWLIVRDATNYLGDGTAKAFRLHLFVDGDDVTDEERTAALHDGARTVGFAALDATRRTRAFGAHGGPAPAVENDSLAGPQLELWSRKVTFGPFGGFGDPPDATLPGSPRHGDSLLHNVLRWQSPELLRAAEAMALQQTLRAEAGRPLEMPAAMEPYREGLGPLARSYPHGFTAVDYEHASAHLLFDYHWLTGDPLAREELARTGRSILRLLRSVPWRTSRGEGQCLEAGVLCARATGDDVLLAALAAHARENVMPALQDLDAGVAIAQPPHPRVLDGQQPFDAVWQMAQLVRGLSALARATGSLELRRAAVRIAVAMGTAGWVDSVGPKTFVSARGADRYTMAAFPADYRSEARMTIGAFGLAAELAEDPGEARLLADRAGDVLSRLLRPDASPAELALARADPWLQVVLDRKERRRTN